MPPRQAHATTSTLAGLSPLNLPSSSTSSNGSSRDTSFLSSLGNVPCAFDECRQFDFLPLLCTECGGKYCGEHSTPLQHRCDRRLAPREEGEEEGAGYLAPRCGFCGEVPRVWQRSAGDRGRQEAVRRHVEGGECSVVKEAFSNRDRQKHSSGPQCSHRRCNKSLATLRLECPKCGQGFCAAHREVAKHDCPAANSVPRPQNGAARQQSASAAAVSATIAMKRLGLQDGAAQSTSAGKQEQPPSSTSKLPSLPNLGDVMTNRKLDKRIAAEHLSQLRALQSRQARGLKLSQADEYRLAELMAEHKDTHKWSQLGRREEGKSRDDCTVM